MPKLIFFSALDASCQIRGAVLLAPGAHRHTLKSLQKMATTFSLAERDADLLTMHGEPNAKGERPWLVLTEADLSNLDAVAMAKLETEMERLLAYSMQTGPVASLPQISIEENMRHFEQWFRYLPATAASQKPLNDPLEIRLIGRGFVWSLAAILLPLSLLCASAQRSGSSLLEFPCYLLKLMLGAGLLIGALIIPVFGGLSEQARTLAISHAVLFLSFQAVNGSLWSANGLADTAVKTTILFLLSASVGKLARLAHETVFGAVIVQSICSAVGIAAVIWLLAFPLF